MTMIKPRDPKDVEDAVTWALGTGKSLEIVGHGTKRGLGRPAQVDARLDLSGLSGVTLYEPEELVLSAQAGTPLSEIIALAAGKGQELAFEPMRYGTLLGGEGAGSIGGTLAANLAGPRRIKAGAARDHFLGFTAVSGRGETFKSGGRVVKNVTGYDLCKLMAGSWGTLAVLTAVTVKTLPKAETEATLMVLGLDAAAAMGAMAAAMGSSCDVSGAAHLPAEVAVRACDDLPVGHAVTAFRLEGIAPSVAHRRQALADLMKPRGTLAALGAPQSHRLWQAIRDVAPFAHADASAVPGAPGAPAEPVVWRISTTPTRGAELAGLIADSGAAEFLYDSAGGLVWAELPPAEDAGAARVRAAVAACGGHAMLVRAPAAVRAAATVFEPGEDKLAALTRRVKDSFDPNRVLNPGRMWAGV